jgi:hypothetical protein
MKNKILVHIEIFEDNKNRGIYGIFVVDKFHSEEFCAYIGKATSIYNRLFCGKNAHLVKLKENILYNSAINKAMQNENKIIDIRVLEEVTFQYENYNKDMQYLASRECYYIDKYQRLDQCLEQRPDGRSMYEKFWKKEKTEVNN